MSASAAAVLAAADAFAAAQMLAQAEGTLANPAALDEDCIRALGAIAAALYRSDQLPGEATVRALAAAIRAGKSEPTRRLAAEVLRLLATAPIDRQACREMPDLLSEQGRPGAVYEALIECVEYAAAWVPGRLDLESLVALLGAGHLRAYRRRLAQNALERCIWHCGDALTTGMLDQAAQQCSGDPYFRYWCFYIAARQDFPPAVRDRARACFEGSPAALGRESRRVLVIQNIHDGQGDEMVRTVPLMQALLDSNPQLAIDLVTGRGYLYSHPRVTVVPIGVRARIEELLRERYDAVIDYFEPNVPEVNYDQELEPLVQAHIAANRPRLVLSSTKGYNRFVYERVELDGRPLAGELGLDRQRVENTYETTFRLIAELGLPLRCGEAPAVSEPVLTGLPWPEAEAAWAQLTKGNVGRRPVALVNPFGGIEKLKGYTARTLGALTIEMSLLVREGFYVVLLPNGTPWSSPALLQEAIARLTPEEQAHVIAAPDRSREADLYLRFIRFAALLVSVEGWAIHAAYCLGKPYRILMLPFSHPPSWHPYLATRNQRTEIGAATVRERFVDTPQCAEHDQPPLAEQPRKFILLLVLRELGRCAEGQAVPFLRRALESEDREIRLAAASSLAKTRDALQRTEWMRLLDDRWWRIRAIAAAELLRLGVEGLPLTSQQVEAYRRIGESTEWRNAVLLGDAARPALEAGLDDDDPVLRNESVRMLRLLDLSVRWRPKGSGLRHRVARLLRPEKAAKPEIRAPSADAAGQPGRNVLILTPVKDAAG